MSEREDALIWQLQSAEVPAPTRELRFHPTRKWRFDLAWPDLRLAVEVEGGIWVGGGHCRGRRFTADVEKLNEAALLGWMVIRVTGDMIHDGRALVVVERAIETRQSALTRGMLVSAPEVEGPTGETR